MFMNPAINFKLETLKKIILILKIAFGKLAISSCLSLDHQCQITQTRLYLPTYQKIPATNLILRIEVMGHNCILSCLIKVSIYFIFSTLTELPMNSYAHNF